MATTRLLEDVIDALQALATAFPGHKVETRFDSEAALIIRITATPEQVIEAMKQWRHKRTATTTPVPPSSKDRS